MSENPDPKKFIRISEMQEMFQKWWISGERHYELVKRIANLDPEGYERIYKRIERETIDRLTKPQTIGKEAHSP